MTLASCLPGIRNGHYRINIRRRVDLQAETLQLERVRKKKDDADLLALRRGLPVIETDARQSDRPNDHEQVDDKVNPIFHIVRSYTCPILHSTGCAGRRVRRKFDLLHFIDQKPAATFGYTGNKVDRSLA